MDASVSAARSRHALLWIALAPLVPQLFGSVFNIWYNAVAINPLLGHGALRDRFFHTVIILARRNVSSSSPSVPM